MMPPITSGQNGRPQENIHADRDQRDDRQTDRERPAGSTTGPGRSAPRRPKPRRRRRAAAASPARTAAGRRRRSSGRRSRPGSAPGRRRTPGRCHRPRRRSCDRSPIGRGRRDHQSPPGAPGPAGRSCCVSLMTISVLCRRRSAPSGITLVCRSRVNPYTARAPVRVTLEG